MLSAEVLGSKIKGSEKIGKIIAGLTKTSKGDGQHP